MISILNKIKPSNKEEDRIKKIVDNFIVNLNKNIKEEIIIQRGFTKYIPKNCSSFTFVPNIDEYFKKARLVISHAATTILEYFPVIYFFENLSS